MSFLDLLKFIEERDCQTGKWAVVNRLMIVCENYSQAKRAYFATAKHCPEPSYGLLELMLSYADRKEVLEILDIIEQDEDNFEFLNNRAIEKYEDLCMKLLDEKPFGKNYYAYGFALLGELYEESDFSPCIRQEVIQIVMALANQMIEKNEITKFRLQSFVNLRIDNKKFIEIRNIFQTWLDNKVYKR